MQRHETDVVSLAFATILISIAALFVTGRVDAFDFISLWALPTALLGAGLVLAAVAVARYRRNSLSDDAERSD